MKVEWGGGGVVCFSCGEDTMKPAYVGRLRCCRERIGICQQCKGGAVKAGFPSPAAAVQKWAMLHSQVCPLSDENITDEAQKWHKVAGNLYRRLAAGVAASIHDTGLPPEGVETALVLLVRSFLASTDKPVEDFVQSLKASEEVDLPGKAN